MSKTRTGLAMVLSGAITFSVLFWFYTSRRGLTTMTVAAAILVAAVVIGSFVVALKRMKEERKGLPADDELSGEIKRKAAGTSFIFSFAVWLVLLLFFSDKGIETRHLIEIGMVANGLLFVGFWIFYSLVGPINEN